MTENFFWNVKNGVLESVKQSIEKDHIDVNVKDNNQRTGLHHAADFGQTAVIEYLLSKGAKINALDNYGITPLLAAAYENHAGAVEILLKKGADVKVKGPDGMTAEEAATKDNVKKLFATIKK